MSKSDQQIIKIKMQYVQARKEGNGYRLYYRGTRNQVFPGETFKSQQEAKMYYRVKLIKNPDFEESAKR